MKSSIFALCFLIALSAAQAETRVIGIKVTKDNNSKTHVAIVSEVKGEKQKDITVEQAAKILSEAKGWGSMVMVGIVVEGVDLSEYLPIVENISKNSMLKLVFIEGSKPDFIHDNIKKFIEQSTPNGAGGSPSP